MNIEIIALEKRETSVKINRSYIPTNAKIRPYTWYFKRKRAPYGYLRIYKARLCMRGDIQKKIAT